MCVNADGSPSSELREQDRFLPIAVVDRIMKSVDTNSNPYKVTVPCPTVVFLYCFSFKQKRGFQISVGARQCMQECASELINFVTMAAKERCTSPSARTIRGEDIVETLKSLGLDPYVPATQAHLRKHRRREEEPED